MLLFTLNPNLPIKFLLMKDDLTNDLLHQFTYTKVECLISLFKINGSGSFGSTSIGYKVFTCADKIFICVDGMLAKSV